MSTAAPKKWDVFLSYHGSDRPQARRIEEMLIAAGLSVWFDQRSITAGDAWLRAIEQAIEQVGVFLVLLTDRAPQGWVRAEVDLALFQRNRLQRTQSRTGSAFRIIPLISEEFDPEQLGPLLGRFQTLTLPADAAHRRNVLAELAEDLKKRLPKRLVDREDSLLSDSAAATSNPFPGLLHFDEDRAHFFFGRSSEIEQCLTRLGGTDGGYRRWLQIDGPSGAGKSSLARAGIVPAIRRNRIANGPRRWLTAVFRPGNQPLENLAESVVRALQPTVPTSVLPPQAVEDLCCAGTRLRRVLRYTPDGYGFLLVIDQLEEIFTLQVDSDERRRFDLQLADALDDRDGPLHLLSTIRSDFASRFELLPRLADRLNQRASRYFLKPMDGSKLRSTITGPLRLAGLGWEGDLPNRLASEVDGSDGALPLLSHALEMLWRERTSDGDLTLESLNSLGGVAGALAGKADAVIDGLSTRDGERARRGLLELVQIGRGNKDVRRPRSRQQVLSAMGGEDAERVLARLSGGRDPEAPPSSVPPRLVTVSRSGDDSNDRVDLIHEALLEHWPRLGDWIEEDRRVLELRQDLSAARHAWQKAGSSQDGLPAGAQLAYYRGETLEAPQAGDFLQRMDDRSRQFLEKAKSRERRRRRKTNTAKGGLAILFFLLVLVALWARVKDKENKSMGRLLSDISIGLPKFVAGSMLIGERPLAIEYQDLSHLTSPFEGPAAAVQYLRSECDAARRRVEADPQNLKNARILAAYQYRLGNLAESTGDLALSRQSLQEAINTILKIAEAHPGTRLLQCDLIAYYSRLGDLGIISGKLPEARKNFDIVFKFHQSLSRSHTGSVQMTCHPSLIYSRVRYLANSVGELATTREFFEEEVATAQRLARAAPNNSLWQRGIAIGHTRLGELAADVGDWPIARSHFQRALKVFQHMVRSAPLEPQWKSDLAVCYERLGVAAYGEEGLEAAQKWFDLSLDTLETLTTPFSKHPGLERSQLYLLSELSMISIEEGNRAESIAQARRTLAILSHFKKNRLFEEDRMVQAMMTGFDIGVRNANQVEFFDYADYLEDFFERYREDFCQCSNE